MSGKVAQLELFRATTMRDAPSFRDDIDIMSLPFFGVSKTPRHTAIEYEFTQGDRRLYIRVSPGEDGIATIWDNDILIYLRTQLVAAMNRGDPVSNRIQFIVNDCLRNIRRQNGGSDYDAFVESLKRLSSTRINTNLTTSEAVEDQGFGWIQQYKIKRGRAGAAGNDKMSACEVVLSEWVFNAIVAGNRVLAIDPVYFDLKGGIERKLYMIARRHVGQQRIPWTISLEKLHERVGAQADLRRFKHTLVKIAEAGLPGFDMELTSDLTVVGGRARPSALKVVFRDNRPR